MRKSLAAAVCWIMIVAFPMSSAMAQSAGAMLYLQGAVRVNGLNVTRTTTLFAGDTVETQSGAASIAAQGAMITLASNSKLGYGKDALHLVAGSAGFSSEKGLRVLAGDVAVSPKAQKGQFQVASGPQGVLVAALNGAVVVASPKGMTEIAQGASMSFPVVTAATQEPCKPGEVRNAQGECVRSGNAAGTNSRGGAGTNTGGMIVGLTSALASAAIAIAAATAGKPTSPVNP